VLVVNHVVNVMAAYQPVVQARAHACTTGWYLICNYVFIKRMFVLIFYACAWWWLYKKTPKHKACFGQYRMSENIVVIEGSTLYVYLCTKMYHTDINRCLWLRRRDVHTNFVCTKYWIVCILETAYHSTAIRSLWLRWSLLCPQHLSCPNRSACSWQAYSLVDVRRTSLRTLE
jgi:hypothetical protein